MTSMTTLHVVDYNLFWRARSLDLRFFNIFFCFLCLHKLYLSFLYLCFTISKCVFHNFHHSHSHEVFLMFFFFIFRGGCFRVYSIGRGVFYVSIYEKFYIIIFTKINYVYTWYITDLNTIFFIGLVLLEVRWLDYICAKNGACNKSLSRH